MFTIVEPRVRGLVAEHLGVGTEELTHNVSLVDELAADSLDMVELALALESAFGIVVPEPALEGIRTYGDLVDTVHALIRTRQEADIRAGVEATPALVWAQIVAPRGGILQRTGWLTPYAAETIAEDALRAGSGARLEMSVPESVTDARLALLHDQFAWLGERGVEVSIRREHHLGPFGQPARPHAAA